MSLKSMLRLPSGSADQRNSKVGIATGIWRIPLRNRSQSQWTFLVTTRPNETLIERYGLFTGNNRVLVHRPCQSRACAMLLANS